MLLSPATIGAVQQDPIRRIFKQSSLDLRFAENKSLADATTGQNLVTFTRASSGTYVDSQGVIRTATTNLLTRSEEFDSVAWTPSNAATPTANAVVAPNGTLTADKLITTNAVTGGQVFQTFTLLASTTYTFSVFAKASEWSWCKLTTRGPEGSDIGAWFNLSNGTVGTVESGVTASIQSLGDGWYRCIVTRTTGGGATAGRQRIYSTNGDNALTTGDGISGIFIWGAQLEQSSTVGEYIPTTSTINSAPRFDHNPTTGESLGLLVEEQRTNSIRNNTMVGAVAGTPGTDPTNWSVSATSNNVTKEVVGLGTEGGIPYVDIRYSGTPTAGTNVSIAFEPTNFIAVASGQTWTESVFIKLQAGSFSGTTTTLSLLGTDGTTGIEGFSSPVITSTPTNLKNGRLSVTATFASASTTRAQPRVRIGYTVGVAFDITLRIGLPQLEQGAFATSVIPTTTAAVTRSADVASITGSNFSSWYRQDEGTFSYQWKVPSATAPSNIFSVSDGTTNNRHQHYSESNSIFIRTASSGVASNNSVGTSSADTFTKVSFGYGSGTTSASDNGTAVTTSTQTIPNNITTAYLGAAANGVVGQAAILSRITYWPQRLPNSTLQQITQ